MAKKNPTSQQKAFSSGADGDQEAARVRWASGDLRVVIPPTELCERLRKAVEHAATRDAVSMKALQAAVCEFTSALRDEGTTPEATLISLKTVINNRALPPFRRDSEADQTHEVRERISTWCIEEFFRIRTA